MGIWVCVLSVDLHTSLVLRIEPVAISWNYCTTELISAILLLLKNKWCLGWFLFVLRSGGQETNWGSVLSTLLDLGGQAHIRQTQTISMVLSFLHFP